MRRLLTLLIVLAALLGVADYGARRLAEDRIAAELQRTESLAQRPEVAIHGFPFLTQAGAGRLDHVTITLGQGSTVGGVSMHDVRAELRGVQVPIGDVLGGRIPAVRVASAAVTGTVPYDALAKVIASQLADTGVRDVQVRHSGGGVLTMSGSYQGIPLTVPLTLALGGASTERTTLTASVPAAQLTGAPDVVRTIARRLTVRVSVPALPYRLRVTRVQPLDAGLLLGADGSGFQLTR